MGVAMMAVGAVLGVAGLVQTTSAQVQVANCAYGSDPIVPLGDVPGGRERGAVRAACEPDPDPEDTTSTEPSTTAAPTTEVTTTAAPTTTTAPTTEVPASTTTTSAVIGTTSTPPSAVSTTTAVPAATTSGPDPTAPATTAPPAVAVREEQERRALAVTGGTSTPMVLAGLLLLCGGASLVAVSRPRGRARS